MANIQEFIKTSVYIVSAISAADSIKITDRIVFAKDTGKLYRYSGTAWEIIPTSDIKYAATLETLPETATNGCIGVVANGGKPQLYAWIDNAWVLAGGKGGTVSLAEAKVNLPTDADAGDIAVVKAENALYYYDGANWVSTEPKVNIDEVYVAAGNIAVGSKLENLTLQEFAERLLTKEINPVITQPSASIAISGLAAGLQEIGTKATLSFSSTFNRGKVAKGWGDKATMNAYYSGLPTSYTYTGPSLPTGAVSSTALTDSQSATDYIVADGAQSWKVTVAYDAGDYQPLTNYGNNFSTKCAAGSKVSNTITITGVYPVYATTANITTLTKQNLVSKGTLTYTMAAETDEHKWSIRYPASWGNVKGFKVADVGSSAFNFMGGGQAESLQQWTISDQSVDVNANATGVAYKQYTFNGANQGVMQLQIVF
jgi:hypothetical protein